MLVVHHSPDLIVVFRRFLTLGGMAALLSTFAGALLIYHTLFNRRFRSEVARRYRAHPFSIVVMMLWTIVCFVLVGPLGVVALLFY